MKSYEKLAILSAVIAFIITLSLGGPDSEKGVELISNFLQFWLVLTVIVWFILVFTAGFLLNTVAAVEKVDRRLSGPPKDTNAWSSVAAPAQRPSQ